jgi:hypothetical protein
MNHLATTAYVLVLNRYRDLRDRGSERGLTTTEVAMLTFILVGIAAAAGVLLWNYTQDTITNVEETPVPTFE